MPRLFLTGLLIFLRHIPTIPCDSSPNSLFFSCQLGEEGGRRVIFRVRYSIWIAQAPLLALRCPFPWGWRISPSTAAKMMSFLSKPGMPALFSSDGLRQKRKSDLVLHLGPWPSDGQESMPGEHRVLLGIYPALTTS